MNTDKLVKAIQIIVKEEIKAILPILVKEGVKKEMAKLLKENKQLNQTLKPAQPTFMDEPVIENILHQQPAQPQKKLSSNPILNEILNQTQPFNGTQHTQTPSYAGAPTEVSSGTMNFDSTSTHTLGAQSIADKMGYGDMVNGGRPQGLGVSTGVPAVDKALNRDYSGLLKAMDKKKGPWRPGMD
jgi:hypothetical protein